MLLVGGCRADEQHGRLLAATPFGVATVAPRSRVGGLLHEPATDAYYRMMTTRDMRDRRIPVVCAADGVTRLAARRETWADPLARNVE
jgi:hypothetical protein